METLIDSLLNVEGALNYWQNIRWVFRWARLLLNGYCVNVLCYCYKKYSVRLMSVVETYLITLEAMVADILSRVKLL